MSVAKVVEITSTSDQSFDDAVKQGILQASKSIDNIRSAWVKEQKVDIEEGDLHCFRVDLDVTFILNEDDSVIVEGDLS